MRILIVEDEQKVAKALEGGLAVEGYETRVTATGEEGFFLVANESYDLVLLDLMLPGRDGLEILQALRARGLHTPVLILTAKDTIEDRVQGLDGGADDYLVKPFAFPELVARIRALLRRGRIDPAATLGHEDLLLDPVTRHVSRGGQPIDLTLKEFGVLEYLLRHQGRVVTREMLARDVWQARARATPLDNVIDVTIARLRRKVDDPFPKKVVQTIRGVGFLLGAGAPMTLAPRSVRARLALWHAGVLTLIVCAFSAAVYLVVRVQLRRDLDAQLARDVATVERTYREASYDLEEAESRAGVELFEVVEGDQVLHRTKGWSRLQLDPDRLPLPALASWTAPDGRHYRVAVKTWPGLRIFVATEERELRASLAVLALILALGVPCAALLAIAAGYFLAGRLLAPVGALAEHARRITAESLGERLPIENPEDEFGRLAGVFNDTLARLQGSFERLRRFTADASHELRTPLTAMRSVGEVALQEPLAAAEYREVIGSMLEEVERLTGLVESLLLLTRADSGRTQVAREVVDLGALAASAVEHLRVLAEEKAQTLVVDAPAPVAAVCDPALVSQGVVNLLDNAIKYTPRGGEVRVSARPLSSGEAAVEVRDTGPGIAPADRERVFERFYRVDGGRARATGGLGLGLAIARAALSATGGRIELESEVGRGSTFRVVLPGAQE